MALHVASPMKRALGAGEKAISGGGLMASRDSEARPQGQVCLSPLYVAIQSCIQSCSSAMNGK